MKIIANTPPPQPPAATPEMCPHSGLHVDFLKKIGKAVETVGVGAVETVVGVALKELGAFGED